MDLSRLARSPADGARCCGVSPSRRNPSFWCRRRKRSWSAPFLRSLGVEPRYTGRREITALVRKLLEIYPNFSFAPDDTRILIETPDKTFAEHVGRGRAATTGRTAHHLFTG